MRRHLAALLVVLVAIVCAFARPALAAPDDGPVKVTVGVYVDRITDMSLRENHFIVDFYVWFRWTGGAADFDPMKTFDVANGTISSRSGEIHEEHTGYRYASCRVLAEVTQFFDVSRFPLDDHVLRLEIEDAQMEASVIEYTADTPNCGIAPDVQVPGWTIAPTNAVSALHHYPTNYGIVDRPPGASGADYSQVVLEIPLRRLGAAYFAKLFFGLFVAVGIALLAFHIRPTDLDPRFGLPVGSIFAAVGSLYITASQLPDTNLLTLSDRLHILAFVVIFLSLVESTLSLKLWYTGDEEGSKRLDRRAFWVLGGLYVAGAIVALIVS